MTPQQIVGLGVRLFAIWLALFSIPYLVMLPETLAERSLEGVPIAYSIGAVYAVIAVLLWFFPMSVAHRLVPRTQFAEPLRVPALEAGRVGCALLGLWVLIRSGPAFISLLFRAYLTSGGGPIFSGLSTDQKLDIAIYCLELLIAIFLLARSASVARLILREVGSKDGDA